MGGQVIRVHVQLNDSHTLGFGVGCVGGKQRMQVGVRRHGWAHGPRGCLGKLRTAWRVDQSATLLTLGDCVRDAAHGLGWHVGHLVEQQGDVVHRTHRGPQSVLGESAVRLQRHSRGVTKSVKGIQTRSGLALGSAPVQRQDDAAIGVLAERREQRTPV